MEEQKTKKTFKHLFFIRLIAGVIFLFFGIFHLIKPENFKDILLATNTPLIDFNVIFVPIIEGLVGLLLLLGFYSRLAGAVGCMVMAIATWSTLAIMHMDLSNLPAGLTKKPFSPPVFVPIILFIFCFYILLLGAGAYSIDKCSKK